MIQVNSIVQEGAEVLRETSAKIQPEDITSSETQEILATMRARLEATKDGVALAAPQIGVSKRIFIVSPRINADGKAPLEHLTYINPVIKKLSSKKVEMHEGCLSIPGVYGKIMRHKKATIEAYDESGEVFTEGRSGLISEIFQHESDHLDGRLFIDSAYDLEQIIDKGDA